MSPLGQTAKNSRKALTSELPPITDIVRAWLKLCGIQPVVDARLLVDLQGSMDENRPSVIGGPTSVLDVFVWLDAQDGKQRISRALRPSTIPQRLWVRGGELRPAYPRLFSKKPKAI